MARVQGDAAPPVAKRRVPRFHLSDIRPVESAFIAFLIICVNVVADAPDPWMRYVAAAVIVVLAAYGGYLFGRASLAQELLGGRGRDERGA